MEKDNLEIILNSLKDEGIIRAYSLTIKEMKKRGIVRTNNIVGELGERIAIITYNKTPGEINLQKAPTGTRNVDALSRNGERYSIKSVRYPGKVTGVFYGLEEPNSKKTNQKLFEYVLVVIFDEYLQPLKILEATWDTFIKHKKWHSVMRAWNLSLNRNFESECRAVFVKK